MHVVTYSRRVTRPASRTTSRSRPRPPSSPIGAMLPVDYDKIASAYDQRYAVNAFAGIEQCLHTFLGHAPSIAELGCGTGHWLQFSAELPHRPLVVGLDRASAMLARCPRSTPNIAVVRGSADQ